MGSSTSTCELFLIVVETIDGSSGCCQALEKVGALLVVVQRPQYSFKLPMIFLVRFVRSSFSRDLCDIFLDYPIRVGYQSFSLPHWGRVGANDPSIYGNSDSRTGTSG